MADGMNRAMLLGNLGADPELKFTQSGEAILNMRLATTESYLDKDKNRQERTEWHSCSLFGKRAEGLAKILSKGSRVMVEGQIRTRQYEKDGEKRYATSINVRELYLCGGNGAPSGERRYGTTGQGASAKHTGTPEHDFGEDDIGF